MRGVLFEDWEVKSPNKGNICYCTLIRNEDTRIIGRDRDKRNFNREESPLWVVSAIIGAFHCLRLNRHSPSQLECSFAWGL